MDLLVLDHFFSQDIEALEEVLRDDESLRTVDYELLRSEALRIFPESVAGPLEEFARPDLEDERRRYAVKLREILEEEFMRAPYDAFVSPSDIFFYVRAAPEVCHDLGVPFLVVQKETTISGLIMDFADTVDAHAPPIADYMTVCGERLKDFWIRAGADPATMTVTGQPRFDFFRHPERWPDGPGYGSDGPVALFFSYHVDHHHPTEGQGIPVWDKLHRETEHGLWELARRGWRVLVKPHPQQPWQRERRRMKAAVGDLLDDRVFLVDPGADARKLVVTADVVVGFQSTALIEALLARRPVVYTGWDEEAKGLTSQLIPVGEWPDRLTVVDERVQFEAAVESARGRDFAPDEEARIDGIVERYLGLIDGEASERTMAVLREQVERFRVGRDAAVHARRSELAGRRPPIHVGRELRHGYRRLRRRAGQALGR